MPYFKAAEASLGSGLAVGKALISLALVVEVVFPIVFLEGAAVPPPVVVLAVDYLLSSWAFNSSFFLSSFSLAASAAD